MVRFSNKVFFASSYGYPKSAEAVFLTATAGLRMFDRAPESKRFHLRRILAKHPLTHSFRILHFCVFVHLYRNNNFVAFQKEMWGQLDAYKAGQIMAAHCERARRKSVHILPLNDENRQGCKNLPNKHVEPPLYIASFSSKSHHNSLTSFEDCFSSGSFSDVKECIRNTSTVVSNHTALGMIQTLEKFIQDQAERQVYLEELILREKVLAKARYTNGSLVGALLSMKKIYKIQAKRDAVRSACAKAVKGKSSIKDALEKARARLPEDLGWFKVNLQKQNVNIIEEVFLISPCDILINVPETDVMLQELALL